MLSHQQWCCVVSSTNMTKEQSSSSSLNDDDCNDGEEARDESSRTVVVDESLNNNTTSQETMNTDINKDPSSSLTTTVTPTTSTNNNNAMINKLNHELHQSTQHNLQLRTKWRQLLSQEKYTQLHSSIPTLQSNYNDNIQSKLVLISSINNDILHLQSSLYKNAMLANVQRIDNLINLYDEHVVTLDDEFHTKVNVLQSSFTNDINEIQSHYNVEKEIVSQAIQTQQSKDTTQLQVINEQHSQNLQEIYNTNLEQINSLHYQMDTKIQSLNELRDILNLEYTQNTTSTKIAWDELKAKDSTLQSDIQLKTQEANKLYSQIQQYQLLTKQELHQINETHSTLLNRKNRSISKLNAIQNEMNTYHSAEEQRLVDLIKRANDCKDGLISQCDKAEKVKKIARSCEKLECGREKFDRLLRGESCVAAVDEGEGSSPCHISNDEGEGGVASSSSPSSHKAASESRQSNEAVEDEGGDSRAYITSCMGRLGDSTNHFWNKYNMTKLDVQTLETKVYQLKQHQASLQSKLVTYNDGISINDRVLRERNPLMVVNGRMNMPNHQSRLKEVILDDDGINGGKGKKKLMRRRTTVVDGNHFMAITNKMTQASVV